MGWFLKLLTNFPYFYVLGVLVGVIKAGTKAPMTLSMFLSALVGYLVIKQICRPWCHKLSIPFWGLGLGFNPSDQDTDQDQDVRKSRYYSGHLGHSPDGLVKAIRAWTKKLGTVLSLQTLISWFKMLVDVCIFGHGWFESHLMCS